MEKVTFCCYCITLPLKHAPVARLGPDPHGLGRGFCPVLPVPFRHLPCLPFSGKGQVVRAHPKEAG